VATIKTKFYNAKSGDAIHLIGEANENIFIDMGFSQTYGEYISHDIDYINKSNNTIDLIVISHVDHDHLTGAIAFLNDISNGKYSSKIVDRIWHNSYRHLSLATVCNSDNKDIEVVKGFRYTLAQRYSEIDERMISANQGSTLAGLIYGLGLDWNLDMPDKPIIKSINTSIKNINIKVLTPTIYRLNKLKMFWRGELLKLKFNLKFGQNEIFDDAFEFYLLNEALKNIDRKEISYDYQDRFIELLNNEEMIKSDEDLSVTNSSSISMIIEENGQRILLTGDAYDNDLYEALTELANKGDNLQFDIVKLSHHGSKNNNSRWLKLVKAKYYVISTDSSKHNHPDVESIINIILSNKENNKVICFNNNIEIIDKINIDDLKRKYNYSLLRPNREWGIEIEL
jgi:metal-dependent hydrolase (beta-lactamase superfamily II)